jgi:hypothetical protein
VPTPHIILKFDEGTSHVLRKGYQPVMRENCAFGGLCDLCLPHFRVLPQFDTLMFVALRTSADRSSAFSNNYQIDLRIT